ncbi:hypothetical protein GALL_502000 [mine drainage metagenome]|uniref:Glutelin n=1 Tax=mine drainage metagenome TaxID=410659 RepID=A0A1J5PSD9_9ZZZZ
MIRKTMIALLGASAFAAPLAQADPLYWSLNVGVPGLVTQFSNVYAAPPVYVAPPPPPVAYYPGYVRIPAYPGSDRRWQHDDRRRWHERHEGDDD